MEGWKGWLVNRVTITFGLIAIVTVGWNLYVRAHNDGILEGEVVDAGGQPVADATVILNEQTLVSLAPIAETTTNENGSFNFLKHDRHKVVLTVAKPGAGASDRILVRLYFRNQNHTLPDPIILQPRG